MHDLEKVIKGLECCGEGAHGCCRECPYNDHRTGTIEYCTSALCADALAILKEQPERKRGHWVSVDDGDVVTIDNDGSPERPCYCSECKEYLVASDEYAVYGNYCPCCGAQMESGAKHED